MADSYAFQRLEICVQLRTNQVYSTRSKCSLGFSPNFIFHRLRFQVFCVGKGSGFFLMPNLEHKLENLKKYGQDLTPRDHWPAEHPTLLAEAFFAVGTVRLSAHQSAAAVLC